MAKNKLKVITIAKEDLVTPNVAPWCSCGDGYLQCLVCGAKIRVGGIMVSKDGQKKRRAWAPWKFWNKHSACERATA